MKVKQLYKSTQKLEVSDKTKEGLLEIVETKSDSNYERVLEKLDSMDNRMDKSINMARNLSFAIVGVLAAGYLTSLINSLIRKP